MLLRNSRGSLRLVPRVAENFDRAHSGAHAFWRGFPSF